MTPTSRRRFLAVAGLTSLAGCSGSGIQEEVVPDETGTDDGNGDGEGEGEGDDGGSADLAVPTADEQLPLPTSPQSLREAAQSGGPPKDGIPSIDDPTFIAPDEVDFLDPGDPVFGVVRDGTAKAYPQKILVQHEVVNDELAGDPVSVTYCPLTGTVQGFEHGDTTFGVSGRLINNNLVMYDRATETWWPQLLATSIPGAWNEDPPIASLREFRLIWTTFEAWREQHPETAVLSTETGYARNYGRDPYGTYNPRGGYYDSDSLLFPALNSDDRFERKRVFMGARTPEGAAAFLKDTVREAKLVDGAVGDQPILAVYDPRYDTAYGYLNPDERTFDYDDGAVVDAEGDGSVYDPDALPLSRVHTFDAMWVAWVGYYPETNVYA